MSLHRIGKVAKELGETTATIRYWEEEFAVWVRVPRSAMGQRWYTLRQASVLSEIQRLLRVELYTIAGAKRQLRLAAEREREAG